MSAPEKIYRSETRSPTHVIYYGEDRRIGENIPYIRSDIHEAEIDALKAELEICKEFSGARDVALRANEEEISILKAELAALKAPPKILKAEEVKEPGCYWWRREENTDWSVQNVYLPGAGKLLVGQFIGPLKATEVTNT